eukprot:Gb_06800 [translate_table: standard]
MGSAGGLVDKATSDLLIGPDWTMNLDICDVINTDQGQAKDVIKAVKKRLGHKNPKVQLLALTLLETMIKNCGEIVHFQVAERHILQEMVKIVRKKTDMHVRDKILVLLDSWQEAFGGPRGKYPQYFWAYDELRRTGVEFPERAENTAPIFTPPLTRPVTGQSQPGYGMPSHIASRLDEAMASEMPGLSLSDMEAARGGMEVLAEMLRAVDQNDKEAVKEEVIIDLVDQCRSNQRRVLQLVNSTSDEELLRQGLVLNDDIQNVLAKHDAIASGSPLPQEPMPSSFHPLSASASYEEDEAEDDFSQLAHRPSRTRGIGFQDTAGQTGKLSDDVPLQQPQDTAGESGKLYDQLALPEPPQPIKTSSIPNQEEQTLDLLSGIFIGDVSPQTPVTPPPIIGGNGNLLPPPISQQQAAGNSFASNILQQQPIYSNGGLFQQQPSYLNGNMVNSVPFSSQQGYQTPQRYSHYSAQQYQNYPWNQGQLPQNSYVVPWAMGYKQPQSPQQNTVTYGSEGLTSQVLPVSSSYPPPPWTVSSSELNPHSINPQQKAMLYGNNTVPSPSSTFQSSPRATPILQQQRSFDSFSHRSPLSGEVQRDLIGKAQNLSLLDNVTRQASSTPKSFIPADRLFEDLIDLRSTSANFKTAGISQNLSRTSSQEKGTS